MARCGLWPRLGVIPRHLAHWRPDFGRDGRGKVRSAWQGRFPPIPPLHRPYIFQYPNTPIPYGYAVAAGVSVGVGNTAVAVAVAVAVGEGVSVGVAVGVGVKVGV